MLFTLLFLSERSTYCQVKIPIQVIGNAEDPVGQRLIYQVKEGIRASQGMRLTEKNENRIVLRIDTMDRFKGQSNDEGISTMYSVIWLITPRNNDGTYFFINATIGYCGSSKIGNSAEGIISATDQMLSDFESQLNK